MQDIAHNVAAVMALLDRLNNVKQTAPNKWQAKCPAHDDRSPSLVVSVTADDKVLIHCFGGCEVNAIVASVGLELKDLFPKTINHYGQHSKKPRYNASELIRLCIQEALIIALALGDCLKGELLDEAALKRVKQAMSTLWDINDEVAR